MSPHRGGGKGSEQTDGGGSAPEIVDAEVTAERQLTVYKGKSQLQPSLQTAPLSVDMAAIEQLDAFREVRTRLLALGASRSRTHFTTLVVGITASAGASFVARNLATVFTLQERVAMLMDCNHRNPTQHIVLGVRADEGGLFDYLDHPYPAVERLAHPTPIPGLHLIPAGRPSDMPREYFSSQNMKKLMAALKEAPCHVFMDGPPVKGSPDARILAELADFVVLVVGYASATPDEIGQAAKLFDPAKFAGVVFNDHA
jgi:protein-tyrosine kinase